MVKNVPKRAAAVLFIILFLTLLAFAMSTTAFAAEVNGSTGTAVYSTVVSVGDGIIDRNIVFYGSVPNGLMCRVSDDQHSILVSGFPTEPTDGSFTVNYTVNGYAASETVYFHIVFGTNTPQPVAPTPTPDTKAPEITKQPEDVTVELGGECTVTVSAGGYSWCAWRFINEYDTETVIFDKVGTRFPGLEITGGNYLTLTLKNVPKELDGWKAACLFGNDFNQTTLSEGAVIRVNSPATPTPEPTPMPTAIPLPEVVETATPIPLPEAQPLPENEESPVYAAEPEGESSAPLTESVTEPTENEDGSSRATVIYVLVGAVAVLAVIWCVLLVRKGVRTDKPRWRK